MRVKFLEPEPFFIILVKVYSCSDTEMGLINGYIVKRLLKRLNMNIYPCFPVDKLLSNEDGGGIFDDPPAITENVMMPAGEAGADDDDDYDNMSGSTDPKSPKNTDPHMYITCKEINIAMGFG